MRKTIDQASPTPMYNRVRPLSLELSSFFLAALKMARKNNPMKPQSQVGQVVSQTAIFQTGP
jgi:hypothetical protein